MCELKNSVTMLWVVYTTDGCTVTGPPPSCLPPLSVMLQVLYKLKTAKVFDRNRPKEDKGSMEVSDEDPFAIQIMAWCPESRMLCVAGVSANLLIYRFSKLEVTTEVVQVGDAEGETANLSFSFPVLFTQVLVVFFFSLCRLTETHMRTQKRTLTPAYSLRCALSTAVWLPCQQTER